CREQRYQSRTGSSPVLINSWTTRNIEDSPKTSGPVHIGENNGGYTKRGFLHAAAVDVFGPLSSNFCKSPSRRPLMANSPRLMASKSAPSCSDQGLRAR